jgi:hypothetical protein
VLSKTVAANLDEFDDELEMHYFRRSWALRELHENADRYFARAAGFGVMRMRSVSEYALKLDPRPEIKLPLPIDLAEINPLPTQLVDKHRKSMLDFVEPDRLGYVRARDSVSGFESHGFATLPHSFSQGNSNGYWQVVRMELVSLLRHDEPRVYVAHVLPQMDELADVPHRPLNTFEQSALPELTTNEDIIVDLRPDRIQMLGAIRAGKKCLDCHTGQRGDLLGAFSYEIAPRPREGFGSSLAWSLRRLGFNSRGFSSL